MTDHPDKKWLGKDGKMPGDVYRIGADGKPTGVGAHEALIDARDDEATAHDCIARHVKAGMAPADAIAIYAPDLPRVAKAWTPAA